MMNTISVARLLLMIFLEATLVSTDTCASQNSCEKCTSTNTYFGDVKCRWCPRTMTCHTFGSLLNRCAESIAEPSFCRYNEGKARMFAKLSAVAYAEPEYLQKCIKTIMENNKEVNDLKIVEAIGRKCERWFDYKECFAYTAISRKIKTIVVGYRGTAGGLDQLRDEATNSDLHQHSMAFWNGRVNTYFSFAFKRLYDPCIRESVKKLAKEYKDYEVVVTGHSLGGALASMTAYALVKEGVVAKDRMTLYTYGMPRVGDKGYASDHDKAVPNSWRIIHGCDIVPRIPFEIWGYNHFNTAVLYPINMAADSEYAIGRDNNDLTCGLVPLAPLAPLAALSLSILQHLKYFGINMGGYCQTNLKYKRETENPRFPEDHCEVISLKDAGEIINTVIKNVTESMCDFEENTCDWIKSSGSTFAFKRKKGPSDDEDAGVTGPKSDLTGSGYYIYAEASGNMQQITKLRSPNFFAGRYCFEFFYHMYGKDMGSLTLSMHSSITSSEKLFHESGDQGNQWKKVRTFVDVAKWKDVIIYFEFEARIGKNYKSDIAIDSIRITKC